MILCSLSGPLRYRFTIAVLPIEEIFHRRGGNQQDKLRIRILGDDLPNCAGQLRARGGLVGQNEIAWHIAPPEKLWTDNRKIGRTTSQIQGLFPCVLQSRRSARCKSVMLLFICEPLGSRWTKTNQVRKWPIGYLRRDCACFNLSVHRYEDFYQALLARDYRFDGKFFVAVKTTGVYCRPICPARPKRENVVFFPDAASAEAAGPAVFALPARMRAALAGLVGQAGRGSTRAQTHRQ